MTAGSELRIFYCYARADHEYRDKLDRALAHLKRRYNLKTWFDREILPGEVWETRIEEELNQADLVFLLISPDFMDSEYCYNKEMTRALQRHEKGEVKIIPILLHWVYFDGAPFSHLQMLPDEAKPVTAWADINKAFYDVVLGVEKVIKSMLAEREKQAEEWMEKGKEFREKEQYEDALTAYEEALRLCPDMAMAHYFKGYILNELRRYEEALTAFEQAIDLNPKHSWSYHSKGYALNELKRYEEALTAFEQAIDLNPKYSWSYNSKGYALSELKRYEEALTAYEQAINLNPKFALPYNNKGYTLTKLGRHTEAQQAYQKARELGYEG